MEVLVIVGIGDMEEGKQYLLNKLEASEFNESVEK